MVVKRRKELEVGMEERDRRHERGGGKIEEWDPTTFGGKLAPLEYTVLRILFRAVVRTILTSLGAAGKR